MNQLTYILLMPLFFIFLITVYNTSTLIKRKIPIILKRKILRFLRKRSFKILLYFSLIWIIIIIIMLQENNFIREYLKLIIEPRKLKLNEWGDFLAGFVAPLAFIWIGFGIYYQKKEFSNIVKSLKLQQDEFKESVDVMKEQVIQIEIQHHVSWFNRNIINLKGNIKELKIGSFDSPILINKSFDRTSAIENKNIFDDIKSIIELDSYIVENLSKIKNAKRQIQDRIAELEQEYLIQFEEEMEYCKKIYWKILVLISHYSESTEYEHYSIYADWVLHKQKLILDIVKESNGITLDQKIDSAFKYKEYIKMIEGV